MDLNQFGAHIQERAYQRDINFYFRDTAGIRPKDLRDTRLFRFMANMLKDEYQAELRIASDFWQAALLSGAIELLLKEADLSIQVKDFDRIMLHRIDYRLGAQYDLLVLSSKCRNEDGYVVRAEQFYNPDRIYDMIYPVWYLLQRGFENGSRQVYNELISHIDMQLLFGPMPKMISTAGIPSPACGISLDSTSKAISSAGVFTENASGTRGVTASLHGVVKDGEKLQESYNEKGKACVVGSEVFVKGQKGIVLDADLMSDSCFIELPAMVLPLQTTTGPLSSRLPGNEEIVYFDGLTSSKKPTVVMKVDPGLNYVQRSRQLKIYTPVITNPGDSGAALYNGAGEILGFCHWRTGYGEAVEFSEWIWARSVYQSLNLKAI